jgi:AcrR family transcriptional regulator
MTFGKKGRPPEDRLARQREIYQAVVPLIMQDGARQLSMRRAAQAACLSIGGLYHYFPTKRELVLHGLCPEAILRRCQDFHAQFEHLAEADPQQYINEGIDLIVSHVGFCRPAIHAALELGTESFWEVIETLLTGTEQAFEVNLQRQLPEASDQEVQRYGRSIRRTLCAALLDKNISPDELRDELHILLDGYVGRIQERTAL